MSPFDQSVAAQDVDLLDSLSKQKSIEELGNLLSCDTDSELASFTLQNYTIDFPTYKEAMQKIGLAHLRSLRTREVRSLLVTGPAGSGKSTLLRSYASKFPREEQPERTHIPVLIVQTPARPSAKHLASAILRAMGDDFEGRASEDHTKPILNLWRGCGVQLVCFDEIHHMLVSLNKRDFAQAVDWLKSLINQSKIPVVFAGLPRSVELLQRSPELARRFSAQHLLKPFGIESASKFNEFRGVLKTLQTLLPVMCTPLHERRSARRMFFASNGLIDYVAKILDGAVADAMLKNTKEIEMADLAASFTRQVWSACPPRLNPFTTDVELLRPLTGLSEPFSLMDEGFSQKKRTKQ